MPTDPLSWLVLLVSVGVTFAVSRWLSSRWRARRRDRQEKDARAGETRQVRRARERRGAR
ncbi:hypothetical protein [Ramlibacter sp. PS4R-6]|uniref:hypothetical protein n=1 Tax=Ramlibacter sp. PS4R-6 TaxID=3133438 RepID=UPI0030B279E1